MDKVQIKTLFYQHVENKLKSAKEAADSLSSGTRHKGIIGLIREIALKNCIRPFLTRSFLCGSGIVIDSLGNRSDQIDAIVYDRRLIPEILIGDNVSFHPVESVQYVFEIKTRLTASELKDARKKFDSMRRLHSFPKYDQSGKVINSATLPIAVLFAFDSDIKGSEIDRFRKYNPEPDAPFSAICVLGKGYWIRTPEGEWIGHSRKPDDPEFLEFCQFVSGMMNTLASREISFKPFSPGIYLGNYPNTD